MHSKNPHTEPTKTITHSGKQLKQHFNYYHLVKLSAHSKYTMGFGIALKTLESAYIRKLHLYSHPAEKKRKIVNYTSVNRMKNWKYVCEKSTNHPTGLFTIWEKFGSCIFHRVCVGECPWPYMMLRDYPPEIPPQLPVPPTWYQPYNTYALHRVRNSRECIFLLQFYSEYTINVINNSGLSTVQIVLLCSDASFRQCNCEPSSMWITFNICRKLMRMRIVHCIRMTM